MAASVGAWRVYLYDNNGFTGSYHTAAGPGSTGAACHVIPTDRRYETNSIVYYAYNSQTNPTSRCKLQLFETVDCSGNQGPFFSVDSRKVWVSDWRNRAASFKTECWKA